MRIRFLGHAGFTAESGGVRVACDPWLSPRGAYHGAWYQFPCNHRLWEEDYTDLAAVVLSHEHLDHLDPHFLSEKIPATTPVVVPAYPSANLRRKLARYVPNPVVEVAEGMEHPLGGGLSVFFMMEDSPANQDAVITFVTKDAVLVNMNDARLSPQQAEELLERLGRPVDALLLQCAGASWYPICYEYGPREMAEHSAEKRRVKLEYSYRMLEKLAPRIGLPAAGPAAFLDEEIFHCNDGMDGNGIFPDQVEARQWLRERGYGGRIEILLPGDGLDLAAGTLRPDPVIREEFSFAGKDAYLEAYARRMRPSIRAHVESLERPSSDLFEPFRDYFMALGEMSPYFLRRINMDLRFVVSGPHGGDFIVRCRPRGYEVRRANGDPGNYTVWMDGLWLHQVLAHGLPWEDFFLSLRFRSRRDPDVYNDHLLSWLKWADPEALAAIEAFERRPADEETFVVETPEGRFRIAKRCPHAGASLEGAPVEGTTITCLNHHYRFDLRTGECLNGNCRLWTEPLGS
ncbi:MAG TPA: MBL fold metallo-hydrolase [Candidatus Saccharimonadales bacterium]|nr:MBL fold metallo-hydrolase [Candidatus Saccharimonadales bacterium]